MTEHDCPTCKAHEAQKAKTPLADVKPKDMAPVMNCCAPTFDAWLAAFRAHKTGIACSPPESASVRELERLERHAWWEHQQHRRKVHK